MAVASLRTNNTDLFLDSNLSKARTGLEPGCGRGKFADGQMHGAGTECSTDVIQTETS